MAEPLDSIVAAFRVRNFKVSLHHWTQFVTDGRPDPLAVEKGLADDQPVIVEDYVTDNQGKSCLVLCVPPNSEAIHVVVGYEQVPMTLVTAYVPDPARWYEDNRTRRPSQ